MKFEERYANAVNAGNLKSEERTLFSSSDVLGAAGLASKTRPLAMALYRLLLGSDNRAADQVVELLTERLISKAAQWRQDIDPVAASLTARLILDWYRDSTCKQCGGHGFRITPGTPSLSEKECGACNRGDRHFDPLFPANRLHLARWGARKLEEEMSFAGPAAMAALRSMVDL